MLILCLQRFANTKWLLGSKRNYFYRHLNDKWQWIKMLLKTYFSARCIFELLCLSLGLYSHLRQSDNMDLWRPLHHLVQVRGEGRQLTGERCLFHSPALKTFTPPWCGYCQPWTNFSCQFPMSGYYLQLSYHSTEVTIINSRMALTLPRFKPAFSLLF